MEYNTKADKRAKQRNKEKYAPKIHKIMGIDRGLSRTVKRMIKNKTTLSIK